MTKQVGNSQLIDTWAATGAIVDPDVTKKDEGWQLGEQPPHEWMNWLHNTFGQKINHMLKNGVPDWDASTEYTDGVVRHNGSIWVSVTTNTDSAPSESNAKWVRIATSADATDAVLLTGNQVIEGTKTFAGSLRSRAVTNDGGTDRTGTFIINGPVASGGNRSATFATAPLTGNRTYTFPNSSGTVLLENNLPTTATRWPTWGEVTNKPSVVETTRTLTAGDGLSGGGTLAANRTFAVDSSVVRTTGDQTIAGTKTFSSSPIVPSPTNNNQAANKEYVDSSIAAGGDIPTASTSQAGIVQLNNSIVSTSTTQAATADAVRRAAIGSLQHDAIGSYALAIYNIGGGSTILYGTILSGSNLTPSSTVEGSSSTITLSGSWRCMGRASSSSDETRRITLWQRVS